MKKSVIAVMLSVVITPAAYAGLYSYDVNQSGVATSFVDRSGQSVFDVKPTPGKLTFFGSDDRVINLDQIQGNLNIQQSLQSQIADTNIAIGTETTRAEVAEQNLDRNKVDITDYNIDQTKQDDINKATGTELADHAKTLTLLDNRSQGLQAAIVSHGDRMNAIQHDVDTNAGNITKNTNATNDEVVRAQAAEKTLDRNKVNVADYNIDQTKQDGINKATGTELADHAKTLTLLDSRSQGLQAAIVSHGDRMNAIQHDVDTNSATITKETTDREAVDQRQQSQITNNTNATKANANDIVGVKAGVATNKGVIAKNTTGIATNKTSIDSLTVQNKTTYNLAADASRMSIHEEQEIVTLAQDTKVARATGEYAQSRAQTAMQNAEKNRAALVATNKKVAANSAELTNHEQRIETLEQSNSASFGKLKSEVEDNRKRASAGIAGVAAMANIPQVTNTQNFSVGAGVGNSDGENALAVGFSARATENVVVKASVSDDSQHNFVVGGGIAYGW